MTSQYLTIARDGRDLCAPGYDYVIGGGALSVVAADRTNLVPNPSLEHGGLAHWSVGGNCALSVTSAQSFAGLRTLQMTSQGTGSMSAESYAGAVTDDAIPVTAGATYTASAYFRAAATGRTVQVGIHWYTAAGAGINTTLGGGATDTTSGWTRASVSATAPANAAFAAVVPQVYSTAAFEAHYVDAVMMEPGASVGSYVDGPVYAPTGTPSDLAGVGGLWGGSLKIPDDQIPPAPVSGDPDRRLMTAPPGGFCKSVFRAARDPFKVTDDAALAPEEQAYLNGAPLSPLVAGWLQNLYENDPQWPLPSDLTVVILAGSPAVSGTVGVYQLPGNPGTFGAARSDGWYGFTSVTPVDSADPRALLEGTPSSTRKVAAIIDLLAAVPTGSRNTIGTTYAGDTANIWAALNNLETALNAASQQVRDNFYGRAGLAARCALAAIGTTPSLAAGSNNQRGIDCSMAGVVALEAGLVGATFTSANYQTVTNPIDAVVAMPSGY